MSLLSKPTSLEGSSNSNQSVSGIRAEQAKATVERNASSDIELSSTQIDPISNLRGPRLDSEYLVDIAYCFLKFDISALLVCQAVFKEVLTGKFNAGDQSARDEATVGLRAIDSALEELHLIQGGEAEFHKDVLQNRCLILYAGKSLSLLSQLMADESAIEAIVSTFRTMMDDVQAVPRHIVRAAARGELDSRVQRSIRTRWIQIKDMSNFLERKALFAPEQAVPSWSDITANIDRAKSEMFKESKPTPETNLPIRMILLVSFASYTCLAIPFLSAAYLPSQNVYANQRATEFRLLSQRCLNQMIGLFCSTLWFGKNEQASSRVWLPYALVAALCDVVTIHLYLLIPNEWTLFCTMLAGATQASMVLQLAIAFERERSLN